MDEISNHLTLFSQFRNQLMTNSLKIFDFNKMAGFFSKNVRELGSQVPNFLHVWVMITAKNQEKVSVWLMGKKFWIRL